MQLDSNEREIVKLDGLVPIFDALRLCKSILVTKHQNGLSYRSSSNSSAQAETLEELVILIHN